MLLVDVKHLSKTLPAVPVPGKAEEAIDAPPAYEPIASTSNHPYLQNLVSALAEPVEESELYARAEAAQPVVGNDVECTPGSESPVTPSAPAPRPSLRHLRASESDVSLAAPKPLFQRPAHSDLCLAASTSTLRLSHARRRSAADFRNARPYSTVRISSAPPFDKSEKRSPSKSTSGTLDASTIMADFLRDLLTKQFAVEQSADVVLKGCADACRVYGLALATLLQEQSIEGHTPIYWAVVKCSPGPDCTFAHELLSAFLDHAAPLTESTLSDIRHACLENPDQALFQWVRRHPAITPLFGASEVLFSGAVPEDDVRVDELPGDNDMFIAHFRVLMFQKRMRVLKHVGLEFIARGKSPSLPRGSPGIEWRPFRQTLVPPGVCRVSGERPKDAPRRETGSLGSFPRAPRGKPADVGRLWAHCVQEGRYAYPSGGQRNQLAAAEILSSADRAAESP